MDQNPLADLLDNQAVNQKEYRLPFDELCAFYAALRWNTPLAWVQVASGLSVTTTGHLKAAGEMRGGQRRYPKIRAEFDRLGVTAFSTKYLTPSIRDRLRVARDAVNERRGRPNKYEAAGVQPRAIKYAGERRLKDPQGGPDQLVAIKFDRGERLGWVWQDLNPNRETNEWRGDPRERERRFATSAGAYEFCRLRFTPTDAELEGEIGFSPAELAADDTWFWAQKKLQK